jgi:hypothetical protein
VATYRYRADVLAELWRHGVQPGATTPPELVGGFVNDLYRYELRELRDRRLVRAPTTTASSCRRATATACSRSRRRSG